MSGEGEFAKLKPLHDPARLVGPDSLEDAFNEWFAWTGRPDSEKRSHYAAFQFAYLKGIQYGAVLYSTPAPLVLCKDCPRAEEMKDRLKPTSE